MATRPRPIPVRTIGADDPEVQRAQDAARDAIRPLQREKRERYYRHKKSADAAAADTTAEEGVWSLGATERLTSIRIVANADIAANGTDYATIIVRRRPAESPNESRVIARFSTSSTGLVAHKPVYLDMPGERVVGGEITWEIEKAGAGVVVENLLVTAVTDEPGGG